MSGLAWKRTCYHLISNDRGAALIITLFIVALVTVLVLEFHFDTAVEVELAHTYASDVQAYYLALTGLNFARAMLQKDTNAYDAADELWALLTLTGWVSPEELLALARQVGEAQESEEVPIIGTDSDDNPLSEATDSPEPRVRISIVDEMRKLPINALVEQDGCTINEVWANIFERFLGEELEIENPDDAVSALIDWQDRSCQTPDGSLPGGAEDDDYEGYTTPDRPMQVPGELRLVRHFTCQVLKKLFPTKFSFEEEEGEGEKEEACRGVADLDLSSNAYLTPYSSRDGSNGAKVNINTAPPQVLNALTDNAACVEEILENRLSFEGQEIGAAIENISSLSSCSADANFQNVAGVSTSHFRVQVEGRVDGQIIKRIVAVFERNGQGEQLNMVYYKVE